MPDIRRVAIAATVMAGAAAAALVILSAGASAEDGAGPAERPPLVCFGTEPFWSLEIGANEALYTDADETEISYAIPDEKRASGRVWPRVLTLLSSRDTALTILRPASCGDDMSDRTHGWSVDMLTHKRGEAVLLTGCCRVAVDGTEK